MLFRSVVPHYTDEMFKYRSGTAAVTEGSSYRWWLIDQYAGSSAASALMYKHATFVDRLPEKDDYEASTYDSSGDVYNLRQSQWSGWLKDLDAIKAYYTDTTVDDATQNQVGMYEIRTKDEVDPITGVMNPKQVDVWLGPLKVERNTDGSISKLSPASPADKVLPVDEARAYAKANGYDWGEDEYGEFVTRWVTAYSTTDQMDEKLVDWIHTSSNIEANAGVNASSFAKWSATARMASINMVNLNDLKDYVKAHPTEADELTRSIGMLWTRVVDQKLHLMENSGDVRIAFEMHAPLNLPKFLGSAGSTYKSIDGINMEEDTPQIGRAHV